MESSREHLLDGYLLLLCSIFEISFSFSFGLLHRVSVSAVLVVSLKVWNSDGRHQKFRKNRKFEKNVGKLFYTVLLYSKLFTVKIHIVYVVSD